MPEMTPFPMTDEQRQKRHAATNKALYILEEEELNSEPTDCVWEEWSVTESHPAVSTIKGKKQVGTIYRYERECRHPFSHHEELWIATKLGSPERNVTRERVAGGKFAPKMPHETV